MSAHRHRGSGIDEDEGMNFMLPADCMAKLDADGVIGGKTWRQMPTRGRNRTLQALNWWLHKRQIQEDCDEESEVAS